MPSNLPAVPERWTGDPNYSQDRYYTVGGQDGGGQKTVRVAFPNLLWTHMDELIGQRRVPYYRTIQDLIRDAVVHRLYWIGERLNDGTFHRIMALHLQINSQEASDDDYQLRWLHIEKAKQGLHRRAMDKAWGHLANEISRYRDEIETMPDPFDRELRRVVDSYEEMLPAQYRVMDQ